MRKLMTAVAVALLVLPAAAAAQAGSGDTPPRATLQLEMLHPDLDAASGISVLTGAYFVSGSFRLGTGTVLVVDVPFSVWRVDGPHAWGGSNATAVGNPYIGVIRPGRGFRIEGGVRLPLAGSSDVSAFAAAMSDIMRLEAFTWDVISPRALAAFSYGDARRRGELFIGTTGLIPTEDNGGDPELLLDYGGRVAASVGRLTLGAGVDGRAMMTESFDSFADRTVHQAVGTASVAIGRFRPGIRLHVPLDDDYRQEVRAVFGASLQVILGPDPATFARK